VTNHFENKKFMQPMRRLSFLLLGFWGAGGEGVHFLFFFLGSQGVLMRFPKFSPNSQYVP